MIRVSPNKFQQFAAQLLIELQIDKDRASQSEAEPLESDIVVWGESNFYIPATSRPIVLMPHQKCVMRYAFTRDRHHFPYQTVVYSTVKQSGKSTAGGLAERWMAETQVRYGECYTVGNDLDQAKGRSFAEILHSLQITPGWDVQHESLPGRWRTQKLTLECLMTSTKIRALSVDAKGEAGGKPAFQVWTELWGFEYEDALRFWDELTPVPTIPDSIRMVETYAGYDGESTLLASLYEQGLQGRQLTAGEIARVAARDRPGETYEELLYAFTETNGNPDAFVPVWVNEAAGLFMYWDSGMQARRMPWQHEYAGENKICEICRQVPESHNAEGTATRYYQNQETTLPPRAYQRFHLNYWVGAESSFIPIELWDNRYDKEVKPLMPDDKTPIVLGVDAATTGDCFACVAVSRNEKNHDEVDVRAWRLWNPAEEGGRIDYSGPEEWLRMVCQTSNVAQIAYDPYQLEDMMQRLRRDGVAWCEPFSQAQDRLRADRGLYDGIIQGTLHHREDPASASHLIRDHLLNANAKLQKDQDSTMRIVKKSQNRKIDLAVAMSMANARCRYLLI